MNVRCLCLDSSCRETPPVPSAADDLVFPIAIAKSVGHGGANAPSDVRAIQQALNRVREADGGPGPLLLPDSIAGPKTNAAISKFQMRQIGFADGRVDPGKRTISALNRLGCGPNMAQALAPTPPAGRGAASGGPSFTVTYENMRRVYLDLVPVAHSCVFAALAAIAAAEDGIRSKTPSLSPQRKLLDKHFQLDANPSAVADLGLIKRTFQKISTLLARNAAIAEQTFIGAPGSYALADIAHSGVLALTFSGGSRMKGQTYNITLKNGTRFTLGSDKIVLQVVFFFATEDLMIDTLIHEMAHYVGDEQGPGMIDDPPGRSSAQSFIDKLSPAQRPRIAECYSLFAFEAKFGRAPLRMTLDLDPF
ncbi:peptidoglycan-binding protein [Methylocella sp.]|uniref:peptidoglycan-binding protein n=1 Tax=Methylocella sp. TaxID=1978226 RepID=UPI0035AF8F70